MGAAQIYYLLSTVAAYTSFEVFSTSICVSLHIQHSRKKIKFDDENYMLVFWIIIL